MFRQNICFGKTYVLVKLWLEKIYVQEKYMFKDRIYIQVIFIFNEILIFEMCNKECQKKILV